MATAQSKRRKQRTADDQKRPVANARPRTNRGGRPRLGAPDWRENYLAALADTGQMTKAAKQADVSLRSVHRTRMGDAKFAADERESMSVARQRFESEAIRRAIEGVESTYIYKDGSTHKEIKYSDTILLRLLEKQETGSWRQKTQVEHSGGIAFKTRAERVAALEKARLATAQPVCAVNGRQ